MRDVFVETLKIQRLDTRVLRESVPESRGQRTFLSLASPFCNGGVRVHRRPSSKLLPSHQIVKNIYFQVKQRDIYTSYEYRRETLANSLQNAGL